MDDLRCYLIDGAVLRAHYRRLANWPTSGADQLSALGVAHVLSLTAEVGLVDIPRSIEPATIVGTLPTLPDTMQHEPSGRLAHS